MHLSPTMETNFVCGCLCARTVISSFARSLCGILSLGDESVWAQGRAVQTHPSLYKNTTTPVPRSIASPSSLTLLASVISRV